MGTEKKDERAFDAMLALNRRMERAYARGLWIVAALALVSGLVGAALVTAWRFNPARLKHAGATTGVVFAVLLVVVLLAGRWLLSRWTALQARRGMQALSDELGVPVAELEQWSPPLADPKMLPQKVKLRWTSPQERSPFRWP